MSEELENSNQTILDLQSELGLKNSQIEELKQQLTELKPLVSSDSLLKEQELILVTADELRSEKLPELTQKLQEYVYFLGKSALTNPATAEIQYSQVNEEKKVALKKEVNSLLRELGNLGLK